MQLYGQHQIRIVYRLYYSQVEDTVTVISYCYRFENSNKAHYPTDSYMLLRFMIKILGSNILRKYDHVHNS